VQNAERVLRTNTSLEKDGTSDSTSPAQRLAIVEGKVRRRGESWNTIPAFFRKRRWPFFKPCFIAWHASWRSRVDRPLRLHCSGVLRNVFSTSFEVPTC